MVRIIVGISAAILAVIFFSFWEKRYEMSEKKDKGFELCYWNLSYRRKMIRTLWMFPVVLAAIGVFYITCQSLLFTAVMGAILFGTLIIQTIYNYRKWKNGEE